MSHKQVTQELFPSAVANLNTHLSSSAMGYSHSTTKNVRSNVPSTSSPHSNLAKVTFSLQLSLFLCQSKLSKSRKQRFPQGKKKKTTSFTLKQLAWVHFALRNLSPVIARGLTWSQCNSLHAYAGMPKLRSAPLTHTARSGVLTAHKVITVFSTRNLSNVSS